MRREERAGMCWRSLAPDLLLAGAAYVLDSRIQAWIAARQPGGNGGK
jgi:hypothetical protein